MRCMRLRGWLAASFFSSMACAHARSALTSGMYRCLHPCAPTPFRQPSATARRNRQPKERPSSPGSGGGSNSGSEFWSNGGVPDIAHIRLREHPSLELLLTMQEVHPFVYPPQSSRTVLPATLSPPCLSLSRTHLRSYTSSTPHRGRSHRQTQSSVLIPSRLVFPTPLPAAPPPAAPTATDRPGG
jgi:hypothetical protein